MSQRPEELSDFEIVTALQAEGFRRERAAKRLGVSKSYLYRRLDSNPSVRRAHDIPAAEIRSTLLACGGDVSAAAEQLRISDRALRLQFKRIEPSSS